MMQGRARPYAAYEQLRQNYTTQMLPADFTSIPADVDVLMIVQPKPLEPAQRYAIDQFVLHGGRALVFVDPDSDLAQQARSYGQPSAGDTSSDLPKLFKAWGIAFNPQMVIGDRALAQPVQVSNDPRNPVASLSDLAASGTGPVRPQGSGDGQPAVRSTLQQPVR